MTFVITGIEKVRHMYHFDSLASRATVVASNTFFVDLSIAVPANYPSLTIKRDIPSNTYEC